MLSGYPFVHEVEVRFRDLDAMGHVNNAVFLTFVESARVAYWLKLRGRRELKDMDLILARTEIDYRSPLELGETAEIGLRIAEVGRSSFVIEFAVLDSATRRLAAEGRNVLVYYDYGAGRTAPLPDALRGVLQAQAAAGAQKAE